MELGGGYTYTKGMEPNNQSQNDPKKPLPPEGRPTYEDFHAEGIDIVANSGISETNEFSMGETNSAAETALSELGKQEALNESIPQKPLTPEQAAKIGNLQEIPAAEMPVPKKPQQPPQSPIPPQPRISPLIPPQSPTGLPKSPEMKNDPSIKQLRTFKTDAEEAVRYQNISAVDIALAEQRKKEASTPIEYIHDEASHANLGIFIVVVMAVIVLLLGGWYYWFTSSQPAQTGSPVSKDNIQALIPYKIGSSMVLDAEENAIDLIGARLADAASGTSSVFALLPKATAGSRDGAPLSDIFRDTEMPESLLRSFSGEYMIGSFISSRNDPFLILKSSSFPITFAGMLEWEGEMAKDLLPLVKVAHDETKLPTTTKAFEDSVVQNVDIRVSRNQAGEIILAYAFPSKDTVVVTTGENSLRHILSELLKVRTIQ